MVIVGFNGFEVIQLFSEGGGGLGGLPPRRPILVAVAVVDAKLHIVVIQKFCYHGNVTS